MKPVLRSVTFSVDCTYSLQVEVPENATNEQVEEKAWDLLRALDADTGDLENDDWEILQID